MWQAGTFDQRMDFPSFEWICRILWIFRYFQLYCIPDVMMPQYNARSNQVYLSQTKYVIHQSVCSTKLALGSVVILNWAKNNYAEELTDPPCDSQGSLVKGFPSHRVDMADIGDIFIFPLDGCYDGGNSFIRSIFAWRGSSIKGSLPVRHLSYCNTRITIYFVFNIIARCSVVLYCTYCTT